MVFASSLSEVIIQSPLFTNEVKGEKLKVRGLNGYYRRSLTARITVNLKFDLKVGWASPTEMVGEAHPTCLTCIGYTQRGHKLRFFKSLAKTQRTPSFCIPCDLSVLPRNNCRSLYQQLGIVEYCKIL